MDLARAFLIVIVGLSGNPEHGELFQKWGASLVATAQRLGVPPDRVTHLGDTSTRNDIAAGLDAIGKQAGPEDVVFLVLIGHGSYDGRSAKFNVKGPDLSAADLNGYLQRLPSKRIVVANTTSASGPFKEELAGPGRTIVTATRSGAEQYATLFGGFFVDAFASETADADKNRRVTVQEAFDFAQREVARAYEREGLLATEHPVLDDTGKLAGVFALGTVSAGDLPTDPALRALYAERRALEGRIEALKLLKESMDPQRYAAELEKLATALALKTRDVRQAEGK